jgi:hypothetical protein
MAPEFYFNTKTHQVEEGKPSAWMNRMGPYPTREAAEQALTTARVRSETWDAEDKDDDGRE